MKAQPSIKTTSLRYSLLLLVLVPQMLAWLVGSLAAWQISQNYHDDQLDSLMRNQMQIVGQIMQSSKPPTERLRDAEEALAVMATLEASARLHYKITTPAGQLLSGTATMPNPPGNRFPANQPVFYDSVLDEQARRIGAVQVPYGPAVGEAARPTVQIVLAKDSLSYAKRASRLARNMLFPLGGLALLCSVLLYFGVQRGLQPLRKLVDKIGDIQNGSMQRVSIEDAPQEIQSVTNALNHLLDTMSKQMDSEKRFINDAAHQLRTPLAGLISQAELAMGESDPKKLHDRIEKMHGAALRSSHLVQQMLSLARSEGNAGRHPGSYDLAALAREVAREWIPKSVVRSIDLGYEGLNNALVRGDRLLMREAISNLIDNAIMYSGEGCVVNVSVKRLEGEYPAKVVLEVADNGPGVSPEQLPEVFKRFWRANNHIAGGCGLGLPLVDRVAVQHQGVATAHSAVPHGFIVRLRLPEASPDDPAPLHDSGFPSRR